MAKDVLVSEEMANKFKTEKDTPYLRFVRGEGLDIISAQYVPNLCTVDLNRGPGARAKGVFINHEASRPRTTAMSARSRPARVAPRISTRK